MPEYVRFMVGEEECDHICCTCGLCTSPISGLLGKTQCWEDWSELVAKFPPIMRVQEGDLIAVHTGNAIKIQKIKAIDKEQCLIQTGIGIVYADAVLKWPWELEKKDM